MIASAAPLDVHAPAEMTWILDHAEPDTGEREADEAVKMLGNYRSGTERALASNVRHYTLTASLNSPS